MAVSHSPREYEVITKERDRMVVDIEALAVHSPFFKALNNSQMVEAGKRSVNLALIGAKELRHLIEFCSNCRVDEWDKTSYLGLTSENWFNIYKAAEFLQMREVTDLCLEFIGDSAGIDQLDDLLELSATLEAEEPALFAINRCIARNFLNRRRLKVRDTFENLSLESVVVVLNDNELVADEMHIFEAVTNWVERDRDTRIDFIHSLLVHVRFGRGGEHLISEASTSELVQLDRPCLDMIRHLRGVGDDLKATLSVGRMAQPRGAHDSFMMIGGAFDISRSTKTVTNFNGISHMVTVSNFANGHSHNDWPNSLIFSSLVEVFGLCILAGGLKKKTRDLSMAGLADIDFAGSSPLLSFTSTEEVYLIRNDGQKRTPLPSLMQSRYSFVMLYADQHVYALGGSTDVGKTRECERYSIAHNKWEVSSPLPCSLSHHAGVVVKDENNEDCLFICGGYKDDRHNHQPTDEVLICRLGRDWQFKVKMPTPRAQHAVVYHRKKVFVVGGTSGRMFSSPMASVDVFDPITDTWFTSFPPLLHPVADLKAGIISGKIYVFGGITMDNDGRVKTVKCAQYFDEDQKTWHESQKELWGPSPSGSPEHRMLPCSSFAFTTLKSKAADACYCPRCPNCNA